MQEYTPATIEPKWQRRWREEGIYQPDLKTAANPFYNLMMFPYPSAEGLHVGNMYAFTGADIYGRYQRMQGKDVFEPIGLDGFGIHSENYALKVNEHPARLAKKTEENFYRQLEATGNAYAWKNKLETYDPDYYKWTQWVFIQMYEHGLAYRKKALVNWCPYCKTVLADEQAEGGVCERCGSEVTYKELEQWFFKITEYAERLLKNLEEIDWSPRVKQMQRNWIGKSEGLLLDFKAADQEWQVTVFTTRPETINSATFVVLAPEHKVLKKLQLPKESKQEVTRYVQQALAKTKQARKRGAGKSGVFTGLYVLNPYNGESLPLWVSDFVLMDYGTGAVMGVPAYDERDREFAQKFNLPIKEEALLEREGIEQQAVQEGWGRKTVNYKLRDWLISRQRYWGPPIPMIKCDQCGWVPVPVENLPVELPMLENWKPLGTGKSPLAQLEEWVSTQCPRCGGEARRETDVSDTFLDSAWYFLRYPSVGNSKVAWDKELTRRWLPVDMYIGGAEHAVLHLLYARFVTMAFYDWGLIDFEEPFRKFRAHGLLIKDGHKMSKSKGNVVVPDEYIQKYGADTLRVYLMFLGPFTEGGNFQDSGIRGVVRFLRRVWRMVGKSQGVDETPESVKRSLHRTIKRVTEDIQLLKYNTAIAALMEHLNLWEAEGMSKSDAERYLRLLAPFAPHLTEELWQSFYASGKGRFVSIHQQSWPLYDEKLLSEEELAIVVQVNGRMRGVIKVNRQQSGDKSLVEQKAREQKEVLRHLQGKTVEDVIFVPGRVINFVLSR